MASINTLLVGRSGLRVANTGIKTTSHNVANAMTPGYSRRSVNQEAGNPINQLGASIGTGVQTTSIVRSADRLLTQRQVAAAGRTAEADKTSLILGQTESYFDETSVDRAPRRLQIFFDALAAASADASDPSLRRAVINAGENLADAVTKTAEELIEQQQTIVDELRALMPEVNARIDETAKLNASLLDTGSGGVSGDLADRRDLAVRELAEKTGVSVSIANNNVATVLVGGNSLVYEGNKRDLVVEFTPGTGNPPEVLMTAGKGKVFVTDEMGGEIGALLSAYDTIQTYIDDLDGFADTFATAMNTQHNAGFDSTGAAGLDLFTVTPTNQALNMNFNATVSADPSNLAFHGNTLALSGDDDNLQLLIDIEGSNIFGAGASGTPDGYLTGLTARIANDVGSANNLAIQEGAALNDLDDIAAGISGVDMDEEASNLIIYQTAFQAAAKVIQTTDRMLGILMELA